MTAYLPNGCLKANNFDVLGHVFHCFLVAALYNLGPDILTSSSSTGSRLSLCNTFVKNQSICCNIDLSVNNLSITIKFLVQQKNS